MSACPFCRIGSGEVDPDLVALRTQNVFVVPALTQRVRNRGHTLVLPVKHVAGLETATAELLGELFQVAALVSAAMPISFGAIGTTVFQNNGVPDQHLEHLHVHVVPRFAGDGFRMPDPTITAIERGRRVEQSTTLAGALRTSGGHRDAPRHPA